jgi:hypothetical protein
MLGLIGNMDLIRGYTPGELMSDALSLRKNERR